MVTGHDVIIIVIIIIIIIMKKARQEAGKNRQDIGKERNKKQERDKDEKLVLGSSVSPLEGLCTEMQRCCPPKHISCFLYLAPGKEKQSLNYFLR